LQNENYNQAIKEHKFEILFAILYDTYFKYITKSPSQHSLNLQIGDYILESKFLYMIQEEQFSLRYKGQMVAYKSSNNKISGLYIPDIVDDFIEKYGYFVYNKQINALKKQLFIKLEEA
jgi:hypothetical protein